MEGNTLASAALFSYEMVARICHEANRQYCISIGDNSQPTWEHAPDWQKESAIAGVRFHVLNENTTPADSHNSWLKQKEEKGWKYGLVKDPDKKEHPCFVPYNELPVTQQRKDYIFKGIVDAFKEAYYFDVVRPCTFGELAVGYKFNPSNLNTVDKAKSLLAKAIDLLEKEHQTFTTPSWIRNVLRTAAFNALVAAQMALVKYLTWKD
jgi:hypothetical protein